MVTVSPPEWVYLIFMTLNQAVVILITSYLIWKIFHSHRRMADAKLPIYRTAMTFMACNWLLTLHLLVAASYALSSYIRFGHTILSSEYLVFDVVAAFLILFQNYLLLIALFARLRGLFQSGPLRLSKYTSFQFIAALSMMPSSVLCQ